MTSRTTHVLAIVGAVVVFVATAVTWYTRDVSFGTNIGGVGYASSKSYTLWDLTTLAPVLLVVGAAVAAVAALASSPRSSRAAAAIVGLLGLGITAYCVVKCFQLPDFGPTGEVNSAIPVPGGPAVGVSANASTVLDAGPFVGIVGGLLILASAVGLAGEAAEPAGEARPPAPSTA
jgi:hypothetical protein